MRKLLVLVGLFGLLAPSPAHAVSLDTHGTNPGTPPPPPVAPTTDCVEITLYAADWVTANKLFRYKFSGRCQINVAPVGKPAVLKDLPVFIQGEWFPQMKRASETVLTQDPDLGITFTTSATCPSDPFIAKGVACTGQRMAIDKFQAFLDVKDIPFAHGRATLEEAKGNATQLIQTIPGFKDHFDDPSKIDHFQTPNVEVAVNQDTGFFTEITGGITMCPLKLDLGDGSPAVVKLHPQDHGLFVFNHAYTKPGVYKVKVQGLLNCGGVANGTVTVLTVADMAKRRLGAPQVVGPAQGALPKK